MSNTNANIPATYDFDALFKASPVKPATGPDTQLSGPSLTPPTNSPDTTTPEPTAPSAAASKNRTDDEPRESMSTTYVAAWCVLATLAIGYLALMTAKPEYSLFASSPQGAITTQAGLLEAQEDIRKLRTKLGAAEAELAKVTAQLESVERSQRTSRTEIAGLQTQLTDLSATNTSLRQQIAGLSAQLELNQAAPTKAAKAPARPKITATAPARPPATRAPSRQTAAPAPTPSTPTPARAQAKLEDRLLQRGNPSASAADALKDVQLTPLQFRTVTETASPRLVLPETLPGQ